MRLETLAQILEHTSWSGIARLTLGIRTSVCSTQLAGARDDVGNDKLLSSSVTMNGDEQEIGSFSDKTRGCLCTSGDIQIIKRYMKDSRCV